MKKSKKEFHPTMMPDNSSSEEIELHWKVHTPNLLQEILENPQTSILKVPLNIFGKLLYAVGRRASQLNDDELNALMVRLTIYEISDPSSAEYDLKTVNEILHKSKTKKQNGNNPTTTEV